LVPKLEVKGTPNVEENWDKDGTGDRVGYIAGKSGSRTKKEKE
jgi:hypothetical protein